MKPSPFAKVVAALVFEDPIDVGIMRTVNVTEDGMWWAWSSGTGGWVEYLPALAGKRRPRDT